MTSRGPRVRQRGGAVALVLAVSLLNLVGWIPTAAGHGALLASDPAEAATLEALPSRAVLTFTDVVTEVREISVTGPDGSVTNGDPTSSGTEVRQNLWAGPDGAYEMSYFVVSADGHDVRGEVHFEVGSGAVVPDGGADDTDRPTGAAEPSSGARDARVGVVLGAATVVVLAGAAAGLGRRRRHRTT